MPPVYDDGRVIVDGGLLNNAPADILEKRGARNTIHLDISGADSSTGREYGAAYSRVVS